jgi:hypothetical protein
MLASSFGPPPQWWDPPATAAALFETATRLVALLELRACRFEAFPFDVQLPRIEPGRIVLSAAEPGIASWSGQGNVELPVRYSELTLGRFVLVPASSTTGVGFAPEHRAEAIAMVVPLGPLLAAALVADTPEDTGSRDR